MNRLLVLVFAVAAIPGTATSQVFGVGLKFNLWPGASWPTISENGLALYVHHQSLTKVSYRKTLTSNWDAALTPVSTSDHMLGPTVSSDGLELFCRDHIGPVSQIFYSYRAQTNIKFPKVQPLLELRTNYAERGLGCLSSDGLSLYFWNQPTNNNTSETRVAIRPSRGRPFVDKGKVSSETITWVSDDQRVAFTWGMNILRRNTASGPFTKIGGAGDPSQPKTGAVTYSPLTGELFYWKDIGNTNHELMRATRKDSLVDYSTWKAGGEINFDIYGRPTEIYILALAATQQNIPFPPFGTLRLGGPLLVLGGGSIPSLQTSWSSVEDPFPATFKLALPLNTPSNATGFFQALTVDKATQSKGKLTNVVKATTQ